MVNLPWIVTGRAHEIKPVISVSKRKVATKRGSGVFHPRIFGKPLSIRNW
jgi:hypothetical protein